MSVDPWQLVLLAVLLVVSAPLLLRWHIRLRREHRAAVEHDRARHADAARQRAHDQAHGIQAGGTLGDLRRRDHRPVSMDELERRSTARSRRDDRAGVEHMRARLR